MKPTDKSDLEKFTELLKNIHSCILITRSLDGELDGRPMETADIDKDGTIWLFTNEYSKKIKEISWDNKVFLTYANNAKNSYVVINGIATVSTDKEKIKKLWNPLLKAWFPEGSDDPQIALIKIEPYRVEYWENNTGKAGGMLKILQSMVTGKEFKRGRTREDGSLVKSLNMDLQSAFKLLSGKLYGWLTGFIEGLPNLAAAILLLVSFFVLAKILRNLSKKIFGRIMKNQAIESLLSNMVFAFIFISGIFISLGILNLDKTVTSLLAGAGIIGLALSFAFQDVAQNFISGVSMAVWRPFNIGDTIETTGGRRGIVKKLNLRTTVLLNSAGELVIIPNKEIHQNILINSSMGEGVLVRVTFDIPYAEDLEHIRQVVVDSLEEQPHIMNKTVDLFFTELTAATIKGEARFFINRGEDDAKARSDAIMGLKKTFDANQIKIS